MRLLIWSMALLLCIPCLKAQEPFSKIHSFPNENVGFFSIESVKNGEFLISGQRNIPFVDHKAGWYIIDAGGNLIDTFFFKESYLILQGLESLIVRGDTVMQMFRPFFLDKEVRVYGSSIQHRDSLFLLQSDWSYIDNLRSVKPLSMGLNSRGNIVIMCDVRWETPGGPSLYLTEINLRGEVLLKKKVKTFASDEWHRNYSRFTISSKVVEINDHYYIALGVDVESGNSFVLKMTTNGDLVWQSDLSLYSRSMFYFDIAPTADSSGIAWSSNRRLDFPDVDDDLEKFWSSSFYPASLTFLDTLDGSIRKEFVEYRGWNTWMYTNRMIRSRFNGDFILCGWWDQDDPDNELLVWEGGMVARVCENEGFRWIKWIPERWEHHSSGLFFWNLTEADNGDIVLVGEGTTIGAGDPGWIMRIGPDGCVPGHTFCSGDSLLIAHPGVVVHVDEMNPLRDGATVSSNPVRVGESISISFEGEVASMTDVGVRWYRTDGSMLPMYHAFTVYPERVATTLPPGIPAGIYILELAMEGKSYRKKIMVVE